MTFDSRKFIRDLMCRQVRVTHVYRRQRGSKDERWWESKPLAKPFVGWVVGATWLQTGERHDGDALTQDMWTGEWDGGDPPGFHETAPRTLCYLVTSWPTVTPHKVPPEAVEVLTEPVEPSAMHFWNEAERKLMREMAPRLPRDEKGRFVSGPLLPKED